jgi:hypothetical protein
MLIEVDVPTIDGDATRRTVLPTGHGGDSRGRIVSSALWQKVGRKPQIRRARYLRLVPGQIPCVLCSSVFSAEYAQLLAGQGLRIYYGVERLARELANSIRIDLPFIQKNRDLRDLVGRGRASSSGRGVTTRVGCPLSPF